MNETSQEAVIREVYEETGVHYEIDRLAVIHENFFSEDSGALKGLICHEISLYYLMKSKGTQKLKSNSYTQGKSDSYTHSVKEEMNWIPICDLDKYTAYPVFLKEYLSNTPNEIVHIVTDGRKG